MTTRRPYYTLKLSTIVACAMSALHPYKEYKTLLFLSLALSCRITTFDQRALLAKTAKLRYRDINNKEPYARATQFELNHSHIGLHFASKARNMPSYESLRSTDAHQAIEGGHDVSQSENEQTQYHGASFELARANTITQSKGYTHLSQAGHAQTLTAKRTIMVKSTIAIVWSILITLLYALIAFGYLFRDEVNDIIDPPHIIDAKIVFYAWIILSIFVLEWLKTALAWFEAAVIWNYPSWAPSNEAQIKLHIDCGWASPSGWWHVICLAYRYPMTRGAVPWQGPGILWWYLAGTYILFTITVPLSGLSMDQKDALKLGQRQVTILGVNETTFDVRTNAAVSGLASNNWRSGRVTTPDSPAVFYAPDGTKNVSDTLFEDFALDIYHQDLAGIKAQNRTVEIFSGPPVAERSHGRAWGFLSSISCSASNLQNGMKLINATGPKNWTTYWGVSSTSFDPMFAGLSPVYEFTDSSFGIDATYVVVSDRDIEGVGNGDYVQNRTSNETMPAIQGALEIAMWQSIPVGFKPDNGFKNMTSNPLVTPLNDSSVLGYGVRCTVESDVGYASLNAATRTYSDFVKRAAGYGTQDLTTIGYNVPIFQYPGIFAIQSIVFQALSTLSPGYMGPPACGPGSDTTCSAFYGANLATGGVPRISQVADSKFAKALQIPSITPERMTLAMYKLFGNTASAMMTIGPGNWTSNDLKGLDSANDLKPGVVPWQLVLVLLGIWTILSILPQILTFSQSRWSQTIEAYAVQRFGVHWRDAI